MMTLDFEAHNHSSNVFEALQCVANLITEVQDAKRLSSRQIDNLSSALIIKENELQATQAELDSQLAQLTRERDKLLGEREQQGKVQDDHNALIKSLQDDLAKSKALQDALVSEKDALASEKDAASQSANDLQQKLTAQA
ncbi:MULTISPECIES: hypothetical protein, partial [unclassified Cyanobium]|uniref:hypothetical protein n=1 Tax=unclassified Cyanobium TaxID=2627006 RepID=UPI0020CCD9CF